VPLVVELPLSDDILRLSDQFSILLLSERDLRLRDFL
jgi:hypothetical protein